MKLLIADTGDRALFGVGITVVITFTALSMSAPLIPLLLLDLRATPSLLGTVIGVGAVGSLLLSVPGGRLADLWGYRKVMTRSAALCAGSVLFLAFFPSIGGIVAGLFFLEIGRQLFVLAVQSQVAALGPGRDLNLDFGWLNTAFAIGQLAGPIIGGLIADTAGYFPAWLVIVALMTVSVVSIPRLIPSGGQSFRAGTNIPSPRKNWRYYLGAMTIIANLASFAVIFVDAARGTFFPVFMRQAGFDATIIGFFMSLRALVSMSTRLYMKPFVAACGGRIPALAASIFVMAVGIALTPFCSTFLLLTLNAVLVGMGAGIALPLSLATVSEGVAPEDRGTAMGIRMIGKQVALVANPFFFGALTERFGISVAFVSGGGLLLLCAIPIAIWQSYLKKDGTSALF